MHPAIRIRTQLIDEMITHAKRDPHRECCGLLAGSGGLISRIFPAVNVAANPAKNYEIAPKEVCGFMRTIRKERLDFLGIYHSHPNSKNEPSPTDINLAYYPDVAYFIISPQEEPAVRAFFIKDGLANELSIEVVD